MIRLWWWWTGRTEAQPIQDAYLEDFMVLPGSSRFIAVDPDDRWMVLPRDRFIEVVR